MTRDMTDDQRQAVLGELLMDELRAIREGIANVPTRIEFNMLVADVGELKQDIKIVKAAVTDLSQHVHDHERRIGRLEAGS